MSTMLMQIVYVGIGVFAGIYIGAIPGLSVTMAASLLISMTYSWDVNSALALMMGVWVGGVYGGSRAAILLNIPGAPAAVATTFDGYPLAKKGEAGKAIAVSTIMSVFGGMFGLIIMVIAAPYISKVALSFSPKDYLLLLLMGLMLVGSLGGKSAIKGIFAAAVGLMLGVVGTDAITGLGRFTFGVSDMRTGLSYITVMIGMFGIGEALFQLLHRDRPIVKQNVSEMRPPKSILLKMIPLSLRSSLIGTVVGALPGAGGDLAALMAYDAAKRTVKNPEVPLGEGAYEGIVAPESANNAAVGGALIPMLTLGIPGDSVTAIMIGALSIHNIRVGPMIMSTQPKLFSTLAIMLLVGNVFLLIFGLTGIRIFSKLVEIPREILMPLIMVISIIGSYSIGGNVIDIVWTVVFGIIGYFMKCYDYPVGPLVLGLILGPNLELNLRRAVMSAGSVGGMIVDIFTSPFSLVLVVLLGLIIFSQVRMSRKRS
ncbi:MAG: tripartite tricarboxylate transporter permease [Eubacterium sp.]|nr:tripartite tricarboxylate transporter permease [Eubacterium sp.]